MVLVCEASSGECWLSSVLGDVRLEAKCSCFLASASVILRFITSSPSLSLTKTLLAGLALSRAGGSVSDTASMVVVFVVVLGDCKACLSTDFLEECFLGGSGGRGEGLPDLIFCAHGCVMLAGVAALCANLVQA